MAEHANLTEALAAFQRAMPTVAKTKTAQVKSDKGSYSYRYADLADVAAAAMPLLAEHGLAFTCLPRRGDTGYELAGMLRHTSGESVEGALPLSGGTPQALGSAITYMRRYLLGCLTGIVTDEDEDGAAASASKPSGRRGTPPAPADRTPPPPDAGASPSGGGTTDWVAEAKFETDVEKVRGLFRQAKAAGAPDDVLDAIVQRGYELEAS